MLPFNSKPTYEYKAKCFQYNADTSRHMLELLSSREAASDRTNFKGTAASPHSRKRQKSGSAPLFMPATDAALDVQSARHPLG